MANHSKWHFIFSTILILLMTVTQAEAALHMDKTEEAVQKVYYEWCGAFAHAKGDPNAIIRFYAKDAVLIPTLSADFLVNKNGGLNQYFTFLTNLPNIKCTPERLVTHIHGDTATNSGFYKFSYQETNKKYNIPARFTFVYKNTDGAWLIIAHHSSKMPE